jgi:hypothetical protein
MSQDMSQAFQERLIQLKQEWEDITQHPESMSTEKKRQCLEELDQVCKSLRCIREELLKESKEQLQLEVKIETNRKIENYMARLIAIKQEMKELGAKVDPNTKIYGYFPQNWVDAKPFHEKLETLKKAVDDINEEYQKLELGIDFSKTVFNNGHMQTPEFILPPPNEMLRLVHQSLGGDRNYVINMRSKIQTLQRDSVNKRTELHTLLFHYKPVNLKALQDKLLPLNKEKESIIYELRRLECEGFTTGLDVQDYFLS